MFGRFLLLLGALALMAGCASAPGAATGDIVMEEFRVPSDAGMQIYVRNKRPAGMTQFSPAKTVIYVHGATYPSETAFDLKLDGASWMDSSHSVVMTCICWMFAATAARHAPRRWTGPQAKARRSPEPKKPCAMSMRWSNL